MPAANFTELYSDGNILTKAQLSAMVDSIETLLNVTKLDSDNIQNSGIATANLANQAVTADKLATAVAGAGLIGGGGAALSAVTDGATIEISANALRVKDDGISTAKLIDGAVTRAKQAALTASFGPAGDDSGATAGITNITSTSITTTGRPVLISVQGNAAGGSSAANGTSGTALLLYIRRSGTALAIYQNDATAGANPGRPFSWTHIDQPTAGTYSYSFDYQSTANNPDVYNYVIVAVEL